MHQPFGGEGEGLPTIAEEALQRCIVRAINVIICGKDSFLSILRRSVSAVLEDLLSVDTECIDTKLDGLQKELLSLVNTNREYSAVARRANIHTGTEGNKRLYSAKYALSSIVFCGECGEIYRRVHWNNRGCKSIVWRCVSRLEEKGGECGSSTISEDTLVQSVIRAINLAIGDKNSFIATLQQNIDTVVSEKHEVNTESLNAKLDGLQKEMLRFANSGSQYMDVADEICKLREMKQSTMIQNSNRYIKSQSIVEITEFLNCQTGIILQYDDKLVRQLVECVTVIEGRVVVGFMSGAEASVDFVM